MTIIIAPVQTTTRPCPPWCVRDHSRDPADLEYREHRAQRMSSGQFRVSISWDESLTSRAGFLSKGPRISFSSGAGLLLLSVLQASDLAEVMEDIEQGDAVELLRRALKLVPDGAK